MPKDDPTPPQSLAAVFQQSIPYFELIVQHAIVVAQARRALYNAYLAEGFTEAQALELCKNLSIM